MRKSIHQLLLLFTSDEFNEGGTVVIVLVALTQFSNMLLQLTHSLHLGEWKILFWLSYTVGCIELMLHPACSTATAIGVYSQMLLACCFLNSPITQACTSVAACSLNVDVRTSIVPSIKAGQKLCIETNFSLNWEQTAHRNDKTWSRSAMSNFSPIGF